MLLGSSDTYPRLERVEGIEVLVYDEVVLCGLGVVVLENLE